MGTSFYGNGVGIGTGEGGTSNYNDLTNKPITNLTGLTPINLSALTVGLYSIRGKYIFNADDSEIKNFASATLVKVVLDTITGDKVVTFETYENAKHISYSVDYFQDSSYKLEKYTYETINANADTTEELPAEGNISQIYSTNEGLYVWNEEKQDYVQLGTGEATEQTWDEM
jgi:hypothetical protein